MEKDSFIYQFKAPATRHYYSKINQATMKKDKNTVILPGVPVQDDVKSINMGLVQKVDDTFTINGRTYGHHHNTLYPITGHGFRFLDRDSFQAFRIYKQLGLTPRTESIINNIDNITPEQKQLALDVYQEGQELLKNSPELNSSSTHHSISNTDQLSKSKLALEHTSTDHRSPITSSTIEQFKQMHDKLTNLVKNAQRKGVLDQLPELIVKTNSFAQIVQGAFQKQYPDLKLKSFHLHTSKTAITILNHNEKTGTILKPEEFRKIEGVQQIDLNKIIDHQRDRGIER